MEGDLDSPECAVTLYCIKPYWNLVDSVGDRAYSQLIGLTNPTIHLSHIPQYTFQNRNVHIYVLNGALLDMGQVLSGICEFWSIRNRRNIVIFAVRDADVGNARMTLVTATIYLRDDFCMRCHQ